MTWDASLMQCHPYTDANDADNRNMETSGPHESCETSVDVFSAVEPGFPDDLGVSHSADVNTEWIEVPSFPFSSPVEPNSMERCPDFSSVEARSPSAPASDEGQRQWMQAENLLSEAFSTHLKCAYIDRMNRIDRIICRRLRARGVTLLDRWKEL